MAARDVQLGDEGAAARATRARGGIARLRQQVEERRLERDRQRPLCAHE
jgi:hypothetical protein